MGIAWPEQVGIVGMVIMLNKQIGLAMLAISFHKIAQK
jgi:hypothetical protein